jgi:signal transduction histidine kinase
MVATSVLTGVVGAGVALGLARGAVGNALSDAIRAAADEPAQRECQRAPSTWVLHGPGDALGYGYDPATLQSANPAAPPLDPVFSARVLAGEAEVHEGAGSGGQVLFRTPVAVGPCGLVAARWSGRFIAPFALRLLIATSILTVLAGALAGWLLVVWPLARRTRGLAQAADALGSSHGLGGDGSGEGDELDTALHRLSTADARIRHDAQTLADKSTALQRHLGEVAHDVRTPLASLQLTLERLSDVATDESTREALAQALSECVSLSGITENLRLKSLVEDGLQPTRGPIDDLARVLERVVLRAQSLARRKGVTVELALPDEPVALVGDEVFLERCLTNLVDNAVRYGERDGHVAVLVSVEAGAFVVTVRDDGPGVSADELARLGERTFRADAARQRDPRGSGLGLAITGELCRRCGWALSFARLEPRGLEAVIRGPRG